MTYTTGTLSDVASFDGPVSPQGPSRQVILRALIVGFGTVASAWVIATSLAIHPTVKEKPPVAPRAAAPANPYGTLVGAADFSAWAPVIAALGRAPEAAPGAESSPPVDASAAPGAAPPSVAAAAASAVAPTMQTAGGAKDVPLPPSDPFFRPRLQARYGIVRSPAHQAGRQFAALEQAPAPAPAAPASDNRNIFQKFFDALKQPSGAALARSEDGGVSGLPMYNGSVSLPAADSRTAVYDIAAHTVYLPDGERLEAHSGLGNRLDDPRHVNERSRGATPPHVYDLTLRGQLFHGVAALRLNPVGAGNMFGRTGLLAHTYMLGPTGASNGCVSFKDYSKFLQAFSRGEVKRLIVVTHLGTTPYQAPAPRGNGNRYASNNS